ncbi:MAG: T9SS type A sorting domain-containing protein [Paludibacter sp.]
MRKYFIISALLLIPTLLFSQLTKELANEVVFEYIQNEITWDYILLRNDNPPSEDSKITVMWLNKNLNAESLSIDYPCWVYLIDEPNINGAHTILYLFIDKNNGDLLEVKNRHAFAYNIESWTDITKMTGISNAKKSNDCVIYSNPISDFLDIICVSTIYYIEIYNSSGKKVLYESVQKEGKYRLSVSSLTKGCYFLIIFDKAGEKIMKYKLIKS